MFEKLTNCVPTPRTVIFTYLFSKRQISCPTLADFALESPLVGLYKQPRELAKHTASDSTWHNLTPTSAHLQCDFKPEPPQLPPSPLALPSSSPGGAPSPSPHQAGRGHNEPGLLDVQGGGGGGDKTVRDRDKAKEQLRK